MPICATAKCRLMKVEPFVGDCSLRWDSVCMVATVSPQVEVVNDKNGWSAGERLLLAPRHSSVAVSQFGRVTSSGDYE